MKKNNLCSLIESAYRVSEIAEHNERLLINQYIYETIVSKGRKGVNHNTILDFNLKLLIDVNAGQIHISSLDLNGGRISVIGNFSGTGIPYNGYLDYCLITDLRRIYRHLSYLYK